VFGLKIDYIVNLVLLLAISKFKYWIKGLASRSWESHEIVYLTRKSNHTREFKRNRHRWVYTTMMIDEKSQSTISTIWLFNRILATVIISFLPRFSIWQFSVVCILCTTHSRTIYCVFRPMSVWLVITRG